METDFESNCNFSNVVDNLFFIQFINSIKNKNVRNRFLSDFPKILPFMSENAMVYGKIMRYF